MTISCKKNDGGDPSFYEQSHNLTLQNARTHMID